MSVIEGIGDEVLSVTLFMFILFIILLFYFTDVLSLSFVSSPFEWYRHQRQVETLQAESTNDDDNLSEVQNTEEITSAEQQNVVDVDSTISEEPVNPQVDKSDSSSSIASNVWDKIDLSAECSSDTLVSEDTQCETKSSEPVQITELIQEDHPAEQADSHTSNIIDVRLKYLDDTERTVRSEYTVKIRDFRRIHFSEAISSNKIVKLIYNGQLLRDNLSLSEYGITNGTVVHVSIFTIPARQTQFIERDSDLDLSTYLWPLFGIVLGICWLSCVQYPEHFNMPSMVLLILFTISFIITYRRIRIETS